MARDISRFRFPQRNQPNYDFEYSESDYVLPREVASYLQRSRRRPYLVRGLAAGALVALAGAWIIFTARNRRRLEIYDLPGALPSAP